MHLDYVGHAEITDRLLTVDPEWVWEPFAVTAEGLPAAANGGMWIRLTVCGVTRIGFGSADGKNGPDAIKEIIGDALRNAAMRFGVGLDLWGAKFKGSGDGPEAHEQSVVQPEPDPTAWQITRYDSLNAAIDIADSEEHLTAVWDMVKAEYRDGILHTRHANTLRAAIGTKKAELDEYAAQALAGAS